MENNGGGLLAGGLGLISLGISLLLIPIYNFWVMGEIIYGPSGAWKPLLSFLPIVGWIFSLICMFRLAQVFGKDIVFCILTLFFPYICLPLIGFGNDSYNGPVSSFF